MDAEIQRMFLALGLPESATVERRVPKSMLVEHGAPTTSDKRAIQDGIDEIQWLAACKPATIGVATFVDEDHEYLEIAVVGGRFRTSAKTTRLVELIHRAIPYPVVLISSSDDGLSLSVAHKRRAKNEAGKVVVERVVAVGDLHIHHLSDAERGFLSSLALAQLPRRNLFVLLEGWASRIEALHAARLNGTFQASDDVGSIERRRHALEAYTRLTREIASLRAKADREKQLNRRVDLNLEIQRLEADLASHKENL